MSQRPATVSSPAKVSKNKVMSPSAHKQSPPPPRRRRPRHPSRRKALTSISLMLVLIICSGIFAQWRSGVPAAQKPLAAPGGSTPGITAHESEDIIAPTGPSTLAKDYIYAGSRLVATDARSLDGDPGASNGAIPDTGQSEPDPPPPPIFTDMAVWRPSNGTWYLHNTVDGSLIAQVWGMAGDKPVPGDYDGDAKLDFAVFRPSNATWYIRRSSDNGVDGPQWGLSTDEPVPGDYDGDGRTDVAVRRGSTWYIRLSSNAGENGTLTQQVGESGDVAVAGDYDGDGKTDMATFRPSDATWTILKSSSLEDVPETITQQWGASGDMPQVGDFDGDAVTDFTTWRPGDTYWRILLSFDGSEVTQQWGLSTDQAALGDYDGDGRTDIAVVRRRASETDASSTWYILRSSDAMLMSGVWGLDGDVAVPGKYNRVTQAVCNNCS